MLVVSVGIWFGILRLSQQLIDFLVTDLGEEWLGRWRSLVDGRAPILVCAQLGRVCNIQRSEIVTSKTGCLLEGKKH